MKNDLKLYAGAAEAMITPPIGLPLAGWAVRAAGDNLSRFVHDDLFARALTLSCAGKTWMFVMADAPSVDPVAVEQIRRGIAAETPLDAEAIMVCATHCHSVPRLHPIALVCSRKEFLQFSVQSDGRFHKADSSDTSTAGKVGAETINADWRAEFIRRAIGVGIDAWQTLRPAEVAFVENNTPGVASSRRVRLSDGSWADPRRARTPGAVEVSRTEPDHVLRLMLVRERDSHRPLAAMINFGCHPWIFSGSGMSAELPGYVCSQVAEQWTSGDGKPVALFGSGPAGDVTAIWNIDVGKVWHTRPDETTAESLRRRQAGFSLELERLGGILARSAMSAIDRADTWNDAPVINAARRLVTLPLKPGFQIPPDTLLADWQKNAPAGQHMSELQVLRVGPGAILGLPGEPFTTLGRAIRQASACKPLLIFEQANDGGVVMYVPDRASCALGGYEVDNFPLATGAGEMIIEQAGEFLRENNISDK